MDAALKEGYLQTLSEKLEKAQARRAIILAELNRYPKEST